MINKQTKATRIRAEIAELRATNERTQSRVDTEEASSFPNGQVVMLLDSGIYRRKQMIKRLERKLNRLMKRS